MNETLEPIGHPWYAIAIMFLGATYMALLIGCLFPAVRKELREITTQLQLAIGNSAARAKATTLVKQFLSI